MRWNLVVVGKPSLPWAKLGCEDYVARLERVAPVKLHYIKDGSPDQVADRMLAVSEGTHRVLLDERGRMLRSVELAKWIDQKQINGCKGISLFIGGADGHGERMKAAVKESWSLSNLTLQHELALVVLLEQIYRGYSILRGEPYHRE